MSHDRNFLDNVVTSTIVFEEGGNIQEYVGGYSDWLRQGKALAETDSPYAAEARAERERQRKQNRKKTKLSYKDQRELDMLPAEIESLEADVATLQAAVAAPDFYTQDADAVQDGLKALSDAEALLEARIERWGELEAQREALES